MLTPTTLKQLCETYQLRPSKKYGQNYLVQKKPIVDMLAAGELTADDTVVEVGPGFGVLTLPLAERVKQVYAFEIERKLERYWDEVLNKGENMRITDTRNNNSTLEQFEHVNIQTYKHLNIQTSQQVALKNDTKSKEPKQTRPLAIIWGNALHQFPTFSESLPRGYKVLANLPYQITSHMLRTFLEVENKPERIVVMVQKEVAERMCAKPGEMSLLSVAVQYYGVPRIVSIVTKGNFFPSPKVDSAIIAITDIVSKEGSEAFFTVVRAGFQNKRKQLAKNLATELRLDRAEVATAIASVCGRADIRAEELSVAMWEEIVKSLHHKIMKS